MVMSADRGNYIVTFTGRAFYPMDPRPEEISIYDIAHALAHTCRFGGHVREFYSVAQHAVLCSYLVPLEFALQALHHDDTEAYCGDMVRPLKSMLPAYQAVEAKIWCAVADKFKLPLALNPLVKNADHIMLRSEQRDLMHESPIDGERFGYGDDETPRLSQTIAPWNAKLAREGFMRRHKELLSPGVRELRFSVVWPVRKNSTVISPGPSVE